MNLAERVEAAAVTSAVLRSGGRAAEIGGAACFTHPVLPGTELNRAMPLADELDLDAIAAWFGGDAHDVVVVPERAELGTVLAARGYTDVGSWMKFVHGGEQPPVPETDLVVRETDDPAPFAVVAGEGYGLPHAARPVFASIVGASGWHCFVAWDGDEPAGAGAVFVDDGGAWLGIGATRPAFRRRGAQAALLAARVAAAAEAGAKTVVTETGEQRDDRPNTSYRNILRAGFREAYLRANWRSPA